MDRRCSKYKKGRVNNNSAFSVCKFYYFLKLDCFFPILTTKDAFETADLLNVIAKREQRDDKKDVAVRGDKTQMSIRERQQFIIEGLPNVSAVIAKRLLTHFIIGTINSQQRRSLWM